MRSGGLDLEEPDPPMADADRAYSDSKYVFFGVPFDATVSHRPGASEGPLSIREESYNFETYLMDLDVELRDIPMTDIGDMIIENSIEGQARMLSHVEELTGFILEEGRMPIMMGGDHSVTIGSSKAFMDRFFKRGGAVVIIDAHLDFRDSYQDNPNSHACTSRRIFERYGSDSIFLIGPRSASRDEYREAKRSGLKFVSSDRLKARGARAVIDSWDTGSALRGRPIYLSIDIDCLDPAYAPGTGTPEPWGLDPDDLRKLLHELYPGLLAMDLVEVSPLLERHVTPGMAAKILRHTIGMMESKRENPTWLEKI